MKRISIERYKTPTSGYSGLIEGETDGGHRWIMYIDEQGRPAVFWPERETDGAVVGDGIKLDRVPGQFSGVFRQLGVPDDADADPGQPEVIATFPVWEDGTKAIVFAVVPEDDFCRDHLTKPENKAGYLMETLLKRLSDDFMSGRADEGWKD